MARLGEQARELLRGRRGVEQRPEAGRDRGHRHHSRPLGRRPPSETMAASLRPERMLRYLRRSGRRGHPRCSRSAAASPRSRVVRVRRPGVPRVARPALRPGPRRRGAVRTSTPTACPRLGAGTCSTGARRVAALARPARPSPASSGRGARARAGPGSAARRQPCAPSGAPLPVRRPPSRAVDAACRTPAPWSPHGRPGPDFDRVLDARTPLLARAFEAARHDYDD